MMRTVVLAIILGIFLPCFAQAEKLVDLTKRFRVLVGEPDSTVSFCTDSSIKVYYNTGQQTVARIAGYFPQRFDVVITASSDIVRQVYALPIGFRYETGVLYKNQDVWRTVLQNKNFVHDTITYNYDVKFHTPDSAYLYIKGSAVSQGDTVRVFYNGTVPDMNTGSDSCYIPHAMIDVLHDEAIRRYERAKRDFQEAQSQWQQIRIDLGLLQLPSR